MVDNLVNDLLLSLSACDELNSLNEVHCNEDNETRTTVNYNVEVICNNKKESNIADLPVQNEISQIPLIKMVNKIYLVQL